MGKPKPETLKRFRSTAYYARWCKMGEDVIPLWHEFESFQEWCKKTDPKDERSCLTRRDPQQPWAPYNAEWITVTEKNKRVGARRRQESQHGR